MQTQITCCVKNKSIGFVGNNYYIQIFHVNKMILASNDENHLLDLINGGSHNISDASHNRGGE